MKIISRLVGNETKEGKLPAAFRKKNHRKLTCSDCRQSYYYDVVKCPVCNSSRLVVEMVGGVMK